jgi:uncharacterized protein (DUF2141 family)
MHPRTDRRRLPMRQGIAACFLSMMLPSCSSPAHSLHTDIPIFPRSSVSRVATPAFAPTSNPHTGYASLRIVVRGIKIASGHVRVSVCSEAKFLKENCEFSAASRTRAPETVVLVQVAAPGRYAIQAFVDENDDRKIDLGMFDVPTEPFGFSNDAPIHMAPPSFEAAAVAVGEGSQVLTITMRYMPH